MAHGWKHVAHIWDSPKHPQRCAQQSAFPQKTPSVRYHNDSVLLLLSSQQTSKPWMTQGDSLAMCDKPTNTEPSPQQPQGVSLGKSFRKNTKTHACPA